MDEIASLPANDRQALFQETANRKGLSYPVIEKDFWVCWTLRHVFEIRPLFRRYRSLHSPGLPGRGRRQRSGATWNQQDAEPGSHRCVANAVPFYIRPQVKLEMGAGSDPYPIGLHRVRSYAAETFPDILTEPEAPVVTLEAERTFWEKATLLHASRR